MLSFHILVECQDVHIHLAKVGIIVETLDDIFDNVSETAALFS